MIGLLNQDLSVELLAKTIIQYRIFIIDNMNSQKQSASIPRRSEIRSRYIVKRRPLSHNNNHQIFSDIASTIPNANHNRLLSTLAAEDAYTLSWNMQPRKILYISTKRQDLKPTKEPPITKSFTSRIREYEQFMQKIKESRQKTAQPKGRETGEANYSELTVDNYYAHLVQDQGNYGGSKIRFIALRK